MKRVLFVDDEPLVLKSIQRRMRKSKSLWSTVYAHSGKEAISLLDSYKFDLLITDMRMPGQNGMDVLEHARSIRPEMPRLVLSGYSKHESKVQTSRLATRFLEKPFDTDKLMAIIGEYLQN